MPFPRKFRHLVELTSDQVEHPDHLWLAYAVCATEADSCGWNGWMIEAAFAKSDVRWPTGTGDRLVPAVDEQRCPACGRETYRTGVRLRLEPSADQRPERKAGVDYDVVDPTYTD